MFNLILKINIIILIIILYLVNRIIYLKEQGYNLFDKNDKFYKDICIPYKLENGTDVLLSDRYNDVFVANQLTRQSNYEYSDYSPNSQYLKCNVVDEEKIETKGPEKITVAQ